MLISDEPIDAFTGRGQDAGKAADIAAQLEAAILAGEFAPGTRLAEHTLASAYGVGRAPVREAIRRLEGRRLLERTSFSGVRVVSLSRDDLSQLLIVREALEGLACRQAAELMTLPDVQRLQAALRRTAMAQDAAPSGPGSGPDRGSDRDFHDQIVAGSRNVWLYEFLCRDLYTLLRMFRGQSANRKGRAAAAAREHRAIVDAIRRRDPDAAEARMRAHIAAGRDNLLAALRAGDERQPPVTRTAPRAGAAGRDEAPSLPRSRQVPRSLVDSVVDRLERAIVTGELAPHARLAEAALADALGVSRGPLREAIQQLEGRRLIVRVAHAGARVVSLTERDLANVLATRNTLEGTAARLAAQHMPVAEIDRLQKTVHAFARRGRADTSHLDEPQLDFHYSIAIGSRNRYLIDLLCKDLYYLLKLYRFRSGVAPGRRQSAVEEHMLILETIRARDGAQAERLMQEHLRAGQPRQIESRAP